MTSGQHSFGVLIFNKVTKGFNIGVDEYNRFMKDFELHSQLWTELEPVTIG